MSNNKEPEQGWVESFTPERCTNVSEELNQTVFKQPSRCKGFFGRLIGLYFDQQPFELDDRTAKEKEFGYGGEVEGSPSWDEIHKYPPPEPPTTEATPTSVSFITTSGSSVTRQFDPPT